MDEVNFNEIPYARWLERALRELVNFPVAGISIHAITEDGVVYSNYHNVSMADKLVISGCMQQDATLDTLRANGYLEDEEEEETLE